MGLTDEERRRLDELADDIARHDPQLASVLSGRRTPGPRLRLHAIVLMMVALPVLIVGAVIAQTLVVAIGCMLLVVGASVFLFARLRRLPRAD